MAEWVICHVVKDVTEEVCINLDKIDCIFPTKRGAKIVFSGLEGDQLFVVEKPSEIMNLPKVR